MPEKYPYLPEGRVIKYVPITNEFIAEAKRFCESNSTDHNHPTGAVIVKEGVVVARGANQSAIKSPSMLKLHKEMLCIRKIFKVKSGTKYWLCPGCASPSMHAEAQAVLEAKKNSIDIKDADLYLWGHWWCCEPCWEKMIKPGIRDVYLVDEATELFKR